MIHVSRSRRGAAVIGCVLSLISIIHVSTPTALAENCQKGPRGCCIGDIAPGETNAKGELTGKIQKEVCADGAEIVYADCWCEVGDAVVRLTSGSTYGVCTTECENRKGKVAHQGIGLYPNIKSSADPVESPQSPENTMCFTREQCQKASGNKTSFVAESACPGGMGRCLTPETPIALSNPLFGSTTSGSLRDYIQKMFQYGLSIVAITAAVMLIWGGFKYIIGSSAGDISSSKQTIQDALIGLVLVFVSVTLLRTLNPATVGYGQLNVYLANKEAVSAPMFCTGYKAAPGKSLQFAKAPPASEKIDVKKLQYEIAPDKTVCGKSYLSKGLTEDSCLGTFCEDPAKKCLACPSGLVCSGGGPTAECPLAE